MVTVAVSVLTLGYSRMAAFLIAFASGLVEPIGGLFGAGLAWASSALLPWGLGFAAGAMIYVVATEIIPETHRRGYETVAVAVKQDDPARVAQFTASHALPFKIVLDSSGELARKFGNVRITPTAFLIDKNGKLLRRYVAEPDWRELHQLVERQLRS